MDFAGVTKLRILEMADYSGLSGYVLYIITSLGVLFCFFMREAEKYLPIETEATWQLKQDGILSAMKIEERPQTKEGKEHNSRNWKRQHNG